MRLVALALTVLACGGSQKPAPPPEPPPSTGMKELAAEVEAHAIELARIVRITDCPQMASELRVLFPKVAASFERVRAAEADPALAKELTAHARAYDEVAKQRAEQIETDLAANACLRDAAVQELMREMPTL